VRRFLEAASRRFEVVIFTASQQSYADKVIDALDPSGLLVAHRLYRGHCTEHRGAFFKDLGHLGRPLARCVLVDNSPISVACNPDNGILIRSWFGDPGDQELADLLNTLEVYRASGRAADRFFACRYGLRGFFGALRLEAGRPPAQPEQRR
jgi:Dullard-like phosphatase family protein